jgi:hypothetical protein
MRRSDIGSRSAITEIGVLAAAAVLFGSRSLEFQQLLQFEA